MKARKKRKWTETDIALNEQTTALSAKLNGLSCPACASKKVAKSGKEKGNQRYRCSKCGKQFRTTTGNSIHHLHLKPKVQAYIQCMHEGLSLRKTAKKIDISLQTAFRWRHRFLSAISHSSPILQKGTKLTSAYTLPFSCKGSKAQKNSPLRVTSIMQTDIQGNTTLNVIGKYGQHATTLAQTFDRWTNHLPSKALPNIFKQESMPCKNKVQIKTNQLIHKQINDWLTAFRGVATKYLENYWKWFSVIRQIQSQTNEQTLYMYHCL